MEKILTVKVFAGAKKEKVEHPDKGEGCDIRMFVKEPAQKNMANMRVRAIIADMHQVPIGNVQLLTGHHSPKKRLRIILNTDYQE